MLLSVFVINCGCDELTQWTAVQDRCRCHTCSWNYAHLADRLSTSASVEKYCSLISRRCTQWVSIYVLYTYISLSFVIVITVKCWHLFCFYREVLFMHPNDMFAQLTDCVNMKVSVWQSVIDYVAFTVWLLKPTLCTALHLSGVRLACACL